MKLVIHIKEISPYGSCAKQWKVQTRGGGGNFKLVLHVIFIRLPGKMTKVGSFGRDHGTLKVYVWMWYLSKQDEVCLLLKICRKINKNSGLKEKRIKRLYPLSHISKLSAYISETCWEIWIWQGNSTWKIWKHLKKKIKKSSNTGEKKYLPC